MNNIDIFNLAVAEIFGECYANFPMRIKLNCVDVAVLVCESYSEGELENDDIVQKETDIVFESIRWLNDAGYLWTQGSDDLHYYQVTLTPKAFEILNLVPKNLSTNKSIGEKLMSGVTALGKEASLESVKLALSIGASML